MRKVGKSSYTLFRYINMALNDMVNTSRLPLRFATFIGAIVAGCALFAAVYYLILKLRFWDSYDLGTATMIIGMFFIGAVQLFSIGILGEYIGEVLERMNKKPMVIERERLNFDEDEVPDGDGSRKD